MVVRSLGAVSAQPGYHTRRTLYPVGFTSERPYPSYVTPGKQTVCLSLSLSLSLSRSLYLSLLHTHTLFLSLSLAL